MQQEKMSFSSICIHDTEKSITTEPHQLPIFATTSFEFKSIEQGIDIFSGKSAGHVYGRYGNPTIESVARKIARLEGYDLDMEPFGIMTSSGMSAISTLIFGLLDKGDKILTQGDLYGGTTELLRKPAHRVGLETIQMDLKQPDQVRKTIEQDPSIRAIYFETPANPTLHSIDIEALAGIASEMRVMTIVDNTFSTPYLQQPFKYGVDFIIHSTTKYINGHGNSIAGIIIGRDKRHYHRIWETMKLMGTNCNPWDAWLVNNGLKTLTLRMNKHCSNAMALSNFLDAHPKIKKVNYPGLSSHPGHHLAKKQMKNFGGMLSFEIDGDLNHAVRFMNQIRFCTLAPTLGDVDTLILHPASSSHVNVDPEIRELNGISDTMIRLSVGIEEYSDIEEDIGQALGVLG